jgi:DNA-binding PadR family transcriptional regulator
MNISKFVVLGALDALQTASGYDIIRYLEKKMIRRWTDVKKGSIYNALKSLEKNGDVHQVSRVKNGLFPTMTLYEVTEQGRTCFDKMQERAFRGIFPLFLGFKLALKFNRRRTHDEIRHFAAVAVEGIEKTLAGIDAYLATLPESSAQKRSDAFFIEHDRMLLLAEKQWIQMVVEKLDDDTGI